MNGGGGGNGDSAGGGGGYFGGGAAQDGGGGGGASYPAPATQWDTTATPSVTITTTDSEANNSCTPGTTSCSAMLSAPSQSVAVSGAKPVSDSASITLLVAPAVLSCQDFDYEAPVVTLTDTGLQAGTPVIVTDTVDGLPSKKGVVICFQSLGDSPPPPSFLKKCHGKAFVGACIKSITESGGNVVAQLELPAGDPRYHIGGETPEVTSVSPTSAKPGKKLTIKGANLSEVTGVTIGGVPANITKAAPTKVSVIVPAGARGGTVVVTSAAGLASGPSVTVSGSRIPHRSSNLTRGEHRRR